MPRQPPVLFFEHFRSHTQAGVANHHRTEQENVLRLRVPKAARGATPGGADERDERSIEEDAVPVNPEPAGMRARQ